MTVNLVLAINDETIIVFNMYFVAALLSDEVTMVIIDWAIMVFMSPDNGVYFGFQRMIVKVMEELVISVVWRWETLRII
jgi:hypothetical protein